MTIVRKWSGDGLTAGTMTTSSAGTGDNAPNMISTAGVITISETGVRSPQLSWPDTSNSANFRWTGLSLNDLSYRHYFSITAPLTSTFVFAQFYNTTDAWRVGMTYTGKLRLTDSITNVNSDSPAVTISPNTLYRVEVVRSGTTATAYLYEGDTTNLVTSVVRTVTSSTVTEVWSGNTISAANTGYAVDDIAVSDTASQIGPVALDAPEPTGPQWYRYNGTSWVLQTVTIKH